MRFTKIICAAAIVLIVASSVFSVQTGGKRAAVITNLEGMIHIMRDNDDEWRAAASGTDIHEGDTVRAGKGSWP